jgi:hypothetical protein
MVKYFHIDPATSRVSEITEGEYEFRLRKHTTWGDDRHAQLVMKQPGYGFQTRFGTSYAAEVSNAQA